MNSNSLFNSFEIHPLPILNCYILLAYRLHAPVNLGSHRMTRRPHMQ
jgi:hypothetical protein